MDWVKEDVNGVGRINIFKSVTYLFNKNPVFGLGPGDHALNGTFEFHNSYLEIFAMTGVLGTILFLKYSIGLFQRASDYPEFLLALIILYAYGFAGFTFRRLIYWSIQSLAYACSLSNQKNNLKKN